MKKLLEISIKNNLLSETFCSMINEDFIESHLENITKEGETIKAGIIIFNFIQDAQYDISKINKCEGNGFHVIYSFDDGSVEGTYPSAIHIIENKIIIYYIGEIIILN